VNNGHAYLGAPYGIYATADGYLALAMGSVVRLGELLDCPALTTYTDPASLFNRRDEIKSVLVDHLRLKSTEHWLAILEPADVWCSDVLTWDRLFAHDGFRSLGMIQSIDGRLGSAIDSAMRTTRCPIRIDGEVLTSPVAAPRIGQHNQAIAEEFKLDAPVDEG
jgi:CoA:oxalate CoA-transferase